MLPFRQKIFSVIHWGLVSSLLISVPLAVLIFWIRFSKQGDAWSALEKLLVSNLLPTMLYLVVPTVGSLFCAVAIWRKVTFGYALAFAVLLVEFFPLYDDYAHGFLADTLTTAFFYVICLSLFLLILKMGFLFFSSRADKESRSYLLSFARFSFWGGLMIMVFVLFAQLLFPILVFIWIGPLVFLVSVIPALVVRFRSVSFKQKNGATIILIGDIVLLLLIVGAFLLISSFVDSLFFM